jgi:hypothetical protein
LGSSIGPWEIVIVAMVLILTVIPIILCWHIARRRQCSAVLPVLAGLLLSWLGVALVLLLLRKKLDSDRSYLVQ